MSPKTTSGLLRVFSTATAAMIGSGIFILPGIAFSMAGPGMIISYLSGGILAFVGVLSLIELITAMPKTGSGDYYYIQRSLGPLMGTISGFLGWMALSLKSAFAIFGLAEISFSLTGIDPRVTALITCALLAVLTVFSVRVQRLLQMVLGAVIITIILYYLINGVSVMRMDGLQSLFQGRSLHSSLMVTGFIFVSFGGLLSVTDVPDGQKDSKRDLPLGILLSIPVVTMIYTLMLIVMIGILPSEVLSASLTPVADSARVVLGTPGFLSMTIAAALILFSTAKVGFMAASRYPTALSDENLFPRFTSKRSKGAHIPVISILLTCAVVAGALLLPIETLVRAASGVILTSYVLTNLAVIILRESRLLHYQPTFMTPLYPWTQILSMVIFSILIVDLGSQVIELAILFLCICILLYLFRRKDHRVGDYALLHLLKHITDKRLGSGILESELRDVLTHRDGKVQDHFDALLRTARIIDLEDQEMTMQTFFRWASEQLEDVIGLPRQVIYERFVQRQEESNTAVTPFLAIPHIVTGESGNMFMMLVRSKTGIRFTDSEPSVHAVFLSGGPTGARDLHLKTLASIGMMVQDPDFEASWMLAPDTKALRTMLLLSERKIPT